MMIGRSGSGKRSGWEKDNRTSDSQMMGHIGSARMVNYTAVADNTRVVVVGMVKWAEARTTRVAISLRSRGMGQTEKPRRIRDC